VITVVRTTVEPLTTVEYGRSMITTAVVATELVYIAL
jgi:hypothetical protein